MIERYIDYLVASVWRAASSTDIFYPMQGLGNVGTGCGQSLGSIHL